MTAKNQNITIKGKIVFDVPNVTRKHNRQADWKRIAMVVFEDDMTEYYSWFIKRRYSITLNKPLRGAHITFVNDSIREIKGGDKVWEVVREKWDGQEIEVTLNVDPFSNGKHWWLGSDSITFKNIREELGLGNPYFDYHMSVGFANELNIKHSEYIFNLIQKRLVNY